MTTLVDNTPQRTHVENIGGQTYVYNGENTAEAQRQAGLVEAAAATVLALTNFRATLAEGVADFAVGEYFSSAEEGELRVYERIAGSPFYLHHPELDPATRAELADYVTKVDPVLSGDVDFLLDGGRMGITSGNIPAGGGAALVHIHNDLANGGGTTAFRTATLWEGSTATPFTNNDNVLFNTYNKILSDSSNYSWTVSAPNSYHDIPAGVTDGGERVGVFGWATSVGITGYVHAGTLDRQCGVRGTAGFQGAGSTAGATINLARAVHGRIISETPDVTIVTARAGDFESGTSAVGIIENSIAVYANAVGGQTSNYSFFGANGNFYNLDPIECGNVVMAANFKLTGNSDLIDRDGNYTRFYAEGTLVRIYMGNAAAPINLYANDTHNFANTGGGTIFATIDATGMVVEGTVTADAFSGPFSGTKAEFDTALTDGNFVFQSGAFSGTTVTASGAITGSDFYLGAGNTFADVNGNYTRLYAAGNLVRIYMGDATDPTTLYQNASHVFRSVDGLTTFGTFTAAGLALGALSLTLTGSIGATGARATKLWAVDAEFTNAPTIGGSAATGSGGLARAGSPAFTGTVTGVAATFSAGITGNTFRFTADLFADVNGNYHRLFAAGTLARIYLGNAAAPINLYANDTHNFANTGGGTIFGAFTTTGLNLTSTRVFSIAGTQVVGARKTGWAADTGTDKRTANATYSGTAEAGYTQATVQALMDAVRDLSQTVKALKADLTSHGLIGA